MDNYSQQYPKAAKLIDEFLVDRICEKGFKKCSFPYTNQLKPIKVNELSVNEDFYDEFCSDLLKKSSDSELYDIIICDESSAEIRKTLLINPRSELQDGWANKLHSIFLKQFHSYLDNIFQELIDEAIDRYDSKNQLIPRDNDQRNVSSLSQSP